MISLSLDDKNLGDLQDPRTMLIVRMISQRVYAEPYVSITLKAAGLEPANYTLGKAKVAWMEAVPDAAQQRKLDALVGFVAEHNQAFVEELEQKLRSLTPAPGTAWYPCGDPFGCGFVGSGASRAMIDRSKLRLGLHDLVHDQYRVLVVTGQPGSGKSHSWLLIDHLREAGKLAGHKCVRVSTHQWGTAEVTGEMVAQAIADRLGLDVRLTQSGELEDARARKILDLLVGHYPADGMIRWIVLDGLDRPRVRDSARDVARLLITMVSERDLINTRLVITGFDPLELGSGASVVVEKIPAINEVLLRSFLVDAAANLGHDVDPEDLDDLIAGVLSDGGKPRTLPEIETAVVRLVKEHWGAAESGNG